MAGRKKSGGGNPLWMLTYADLTTLLLTFFVMLLSMSVIDDRSRRVVLGSLSQAFGTREDIFNPLADDAKNWSHEPGAMDAPRDDLSPLRDMLIEDVNNDLDFQENKYVQIFSINDEVLFEPGGASLSPGGIALLDRILPYLQRINYPLLVAGHTAARRDEEGDNYHLPHVVQGMDGTWALSYKRALAVYRHLGARGIEASRLSQEAFGQFHPRFSNNDPEGRRKNRRVDLVLDKRNREWIDKVEALRERENPKAETYYKGFRFDLNMPGTGGGQEGGQ